MSAYTYIRVFKKDKSYIVSENSVLGITQVDFEAKENFVISDLSISFYKGIRSLGKLRYVDLGNAFEVYQSYFELFMFYALAHGEYGEAVRKNGDKIESLAFDPNRVLKGVDILLQVIEYFEKDDINELQEYNEIENLNQLRKTLIKAIELDALICCSTN